MKAFLFASDTEGMGNTFGFSAGYEYLPASSLGFLGQASLLKVSDKRDGEKSNFDILRYEANAAWTFTNFLFIKGGLN